MSTTIPGTRPRVRRLQPAPPDEQPSAFPSRDFYARPGMTLRDYFAAKAMRGLMANMLAGDDGQLARRAYEIADAMMRERETRDAV